MATKLVVWLTIFAFSGYCAASPIEGKGARQPDSSNDPLRRFVSQWNDIGKMYRTDDKFRTSVRVSDYYYQMAQLSRDTDPRGPAVDIPAMPFTCDPALGVSASPPTSVHMLKPGDINVVGAIGDSFIGGNGITSPIALGVIFANRGESFASGGDFDLEMNVTTVPNLLRQFNPNLKGASRCISQAHTWEYSQLNFADAGALSNDFAGQATALVSRIKNSSDIDVANDWKMLTLLAGTGDLCFHCQEPAERTAAKFEANVRAALDILHQELPRTFVNLIPMMDLSFLENVVFNHENTSYPGDPPPNLFNLLDPADNFTFYPAICGRLHERFCPCALPAIAPKEDMQNLQQEYYSVLENVANDDGYNNGDDFQVVLQPHYKDAVPIPDSSHGQGLLDNRYFAPDCFHPNRRTHQIYAQMLWNVMLTKVGEKPLDHVLESGFRCPTASEPYIFTSQNSVTAP